MKIIQLTLIICVFSVYGFPQKESDTFSKISSEEVMPVVVMQPDSPLLIESFSLGRNSSGKIQSFYQIRNRGLKPVKHYTIARWYSDNTGFTGNGEMPSDDLFDPGATTTNFHGVWKSEMDAKSMTSLQKIAFILVLEVVFSDGTKFDATKDFKALETHLKLFESKYDAIKNQ